jgi:FtsH-binding integral membrane protein
MLAEADVILADLWAIAEELARTTPESDVLGLYIETLNETIDLDTSRIVAALYARVPETVMLLLFVGSALTLGMVGFNAGLSGRRSPLTAIVMIVVLGAVITLIVDIDSPQRGTLIVSQQPLIQLANELGAPLE